MPKKIYTKIEVIEYFTVKLHSDYSINQVEQFIALADRDELPPDYTINAGYEFVMMVSAGKYNILRQVNGKLVNAEK